jgi:hypothetical protein
MNPNTTPIPEFTKPCACRTVEDKLAEIDEKIALLMAAYILRTQPQDDDEDDDEKKPDNSIALINNILFELEVKIPLWQGEHRLRWLRKYLHADSPLEVLDPEVLREGLRILNGMKMPLQPPPKEDK